MNKWSVTYPTELSYFRVGGTSETTEPKILTVENIKEEVLSKSYSIILIASAAKHPPRVDIHTVLAIYLKLVVIILTVFFSG